MKKYKFYFCFLLGILFISCEKEYVEWDSTHIIPIAKGKLDISDILSIHDSLLMLDDKGLISFVLSQSIFKLPASEILVIKETNISKTISLQTITLGSRIIENQYTMADAARQMGEPFTSFIFSQHGGTMQMPPYSGMNGDIVVDATDFFQTATFSDGNLELVIINGFQIDLTNIEFRLENSNDKQLILSENISIIESGTTFRKNYSLEGKTLEGIMIARIINMDTPGSYGEEVPVDTNDAVEIKLIASNLDVYSATAIFPAQSLFNTTDDVVYDMGGAGITEMKIRSGYIQVISFNTINDSVFMYYTVPDAIKNGKALEIYSSVPPGTPENAAHINKIVDIEGYVINYTGKNNDTVNTFSNYLDVSIDSSGKLITISLDDSIQINYGLFEIVPEYAFGYMGKHNFDLTRDTIIDFFIEKFKGGSIKPEYLDARIVIYNETGIRGAVQINKIYAENKLSGKSTNLNFPDIGKPVNILQANAISLEPYVSTININSENSNIVSFFDILPDYILYEIEVSLNPQGNNMLYDDFIYYDNEIEAKLEIDLPLNLKVNELVIEKHQEYNLNLDKDVLKQIQGMTLNISYVNKFPFEATFDLYVLNDDNEIISKLNNEFSDNILKGAKFPDATGRMQSPAEGIIKLVIGKQQILELTKNNTLLAKITLNTTTTDAVKIYNDYDISFNIDGELIYRLNTERF